MKKTIWSDWVCDGIISHIWVNELQRRSVICRQPRSQTVSGGGGPGVGGGSPSVSCRVASFPGVGLGAETLSLPHHRLDHRGGSPLQLGYVVLLGQTLHDTLHGAAVTQRRTEGRRRRRYWSLIGSKVMHLKGQFTPEFQLHFSPSLKWDFYPSR